MKFSNSTLAREPRASSRDTSTLSFVLWTTTKIFES